MPPINTVERETLRMRSVQSPVIPVVGDLIRNHPGTISLGQGVVFYAPPPESTECLHQYFLDPNHHKYQPVEGIAPLRACIEKKLAEENGIALEPQSALVVSAGSNMAFMNAILAITDPGDEVVIQLPYYFNHEMAIRIADCTPVPVETDEQYQLNPTAVEGAITGRTRAIVTISPNNPTGAVYSERALRQVNEICRQAGIYHIHDEAYEYFTYGDAVHFSPGSIEASAGYTISLFSLSKSYGFASWRVGYMTLPKHLYFSVKKIQDTIVICPPVVSQAAATAAIRIGSSYCRHHLESISAVRALVLEELSGIQSFCTVPQTDGAFYFLLRLDTQKTPMELTEALVREAGVAVIPGSTFGVEGRCTLRMSYGSLDRDTVAEGVGRLVKGLKDLVSH